MARPRKDKGAGGYTVIMRPPAGERQFVLDADGNETSRILQEKIVIMDAESEADAREQAIQKALDQTNPALTASPRDCVYQIHSIEKIG